MALRVVFADDDYLVREGVAALLGRVDRVELVGTAQDMPGLLGAVDEHRPDAVLTDIRMPPTGLNEGIRAAKAIRRDHPGIGVVVLSQYAESGYAYDLLGESAEGLGYLLKERVTHVDELVRALEETARGGSALDPKVVDALLAERRRVAASPLNLLSEREHEVLALMAEGNNNARIATKLTVSVRGVEKHINAIFSKLGIAEEPVVHRRVKAVLLYLDDQGLLSPG
ncbi:response regulator transcription factor [Actinomadura rudentiformis]|uniref:Response regulator transcription factor n=1 Tax=Actinomadura rudentiformis TaxID=359158 RepID=A0A6H9YHM7_9ACTN|nr:response regulator transcription factor [Actinomadura rudentiformis]KAB2340165.1 response regulator transcription factor [Actinomadura rudentiformis]